MQALKLLMLLVMLRQVRACRLLMNDGRICVAHSSIARPLSATMHGGNGRPHGIAASGPQRHPLLVSTAPPQPRSRTSLTAGMASRRSERSHMARSHSKAAWGSACELHDTKNLIAKPASPCAARANCTARGPRTTSAGAHSMLIARSSLLRVFLHGTFVFSSVHERIAVGNVTRRIAILS